MDKIFMQKTSKKTFIDYMQTNEFLKNPLVFSKAKGVYLWDVDGKKYFDGIGGIFVATLGHCHPRLVEAMKRQMEKMTFCPPLHSVSDITLELVDKIGTLTPENLNFVKTYSGGSESIESAFKFSRQYHRQSGNPSKMKTICHYLSYHGATFATMAAGGQALRYRYDPAMSGFLKVPSPKQLRDDFPTWEETCRYAAMMVRRTIEFENPETVGAYIVEPICNIAGMIIPTEEFFQIVRKACDDYNVIMIADEVLTGWCKTGAFFALQTFGITPDIICSGKGLSSGMMPLGAMIAREDMGNMFLGNEEDGVHFAHGHSFANFPLGSAVALEAIAVMEEEKLYDRALLIGEYLLSRFNKLKERFGVVREVRGRGALVCLEFMKDEKTKSPYPELGRAFKLCSVKNGLIVRCDHEWFSVAPPLISTDEELRELCDLVEKSFADALDMVTAQK